MLKGDDHETAGARYSRTVSTTNSGASTNGTKLIVFRRTTQAGDTSVNLAFNAVDTKSATLAVYRGVDPSNPVDAMSSAGNEATKTVQVPSVTTSIANTKLVNLAGEINNAGNWTAPSGMTSRAVASGGTSRTLIADQTIANPGATGTRTDTFSVFAKLSGTLVALKPASGTYAYTYDNRGNRTTITPAGSTPTTLGYDQANRLTSYGATTSYAYNGDGLRQSKTVSGTTTQQTWDVSGELPLLIADGATNYIYGPGGMPIEQVAGTTTLYYHQDQLGSTRALTDTTGATVATYTYDSYGRRTGSTGTINTPLGYAAQYTDQESGFQYLRARYYDPTTGQFLTRDPMSAVTGTPYAYAANDPVNYVDPTGEFAQVVVGAIIGGGIDLGMQMLDNAQDGCGSFSDIDWGSVAQSATIGGITGGVFSGITKLRTGGRFSVALRNITWADETGSIGMPGKWMSPNAFADDLIRQARNVYRGAPTETGQHGTGLLAAARDLRQQARANGYLPEIADRLLRAANQFEGRARGINHPGGWR